MIITGPGVPPKEEVTDHERPAQRTSPRRHIYVCIYIYMYIAVYVYVYVCTYIYIYIYVHRKTYIYI